MYCAYGCVRVLRSVWWNKCFEYVPVLLDCWCQEEIVKEAIWILSGICLHLHFCVGPFAHMRRKDKSWQSQSLSSARSCCLAGHFRRWHQFLLGLESSKTAIDNSFVKSLKLLSSGFLSIHSDDEGIWRMCFRSLSFQFQLLVFSKMKTQETFVMLVNLVTDLLPLYLAFWKTGLDLLYLYWQYEDMSNMILKTAQIHCRSWQLAGWWKFVLLFYSNSLLRQMDDDACHELIRVYWCVYVFGMGHCMDATQALVRTVQRGRKLSTTRMPGKQLKMTLVSHLFEAHFELFYSTLMVPILVEWILEKERERERETERAEVIIQSFSAF